MNFKITMPTPEPTLSTADKIAILAGDPANHPAIAALLAQAEDSAQRLAIATESQREAGKEGSIKDRHFYRGQCAAFKHALLTICEAITSLAGMDHHKGRDLAEELEAAAEKARAH